MNEELKLRYPDWPVGRVAHAEDCKSLYIGSIPVPASKIHSLPHLLFRLSSAVEQSAVNRLVACSNQAAGANPDPLISLIACQRVFLLKILYFFH